MHINEPTTILNSEHLHKQARKSSNFRYFKSTSVEAKICGTYIYISKKLVINHNQTSHE